MSDGDLVGGHARPVAAGPGAESRAPAAADGDGELDGSVAALQDAADAEWQGQAAPSLPAPAAPFGGAAIGQVRAGADPRWHAGVASGSGYGLGVPGPACVPAPFPPLPGYGMPYFPLPPGAAYGVYMGDASAPTRRQRAMSASAVHHAAHLPFAIGPELASGYPPLEASADSPAVAAAMAAAASSASAARLQHELPSPHQLHSYHQAMAGQYASPHYHTLAHLPASPQQFGSPHVQQMSPHRYPPAPHAAFLPGHALGYGHGQAGRAAEATAFARSRSYGAGVADRGACAPAAPGMRARDHGQPSPQAFALAATVATHRGAEAAASDSDVVFDMELDAQ